MIATHLQRDSSLCLGQLRNDVLTLETSEYTQSDFRKGSVRKELLYYILIGFGVPMSLVTLIEMC
jgi:hypothetical protein